MSRETDWYQVGKYRFALVLNKGHLFFRSWGIALTTDGGCLGSTYGEPGLDMSRAFHLTFICWTLSLRIYWKKLRKGEKDAADRNRDRS